MPTSTVTSKGQVTIPKQVRDRLGVTGGSVSLRPLKRTVRELAGFLQRRERAAVTQGEMDAIVLDLIAEDDERILRYSPL